MKYCSGCDQNLEFSAFGKDKYRKDGLTTRCKKCRNKKNREYMKRNPEMRKKHNRQNRQKRKEFYSSPEGILSSRNSHLKKYGMSHDDYVIMLEKQNGVCCICKRHRIASNKGHMVVDHCHETGKVRGILCNWCNRGLGLFEDNIDFFKNAIIYLKESK